MFEYKGYWADVRAVPNEYGDTILIGQVLDIADTVTFQTKRIANIEREFHRAVDDYLQFCRELGQDPRHPIPPKTQWMVAYPFRTSPEIRQFIQKAADRDHTTVNCWMEQALPSASYSVRYFLDNPVALDELLGKILPYLNDEELDSAIPLRYALEKLLAGMDAMREFLNYSNYESFAKIVTKIEEALKNIPSIDERLMVDICSPAEDMKVGGSGR